MQALAAVSAKGTYSSPNVAAATSRPWTPCIFEGGFRTELSIAQVAFLLPSCRVDEGVELLVRLLFVQRR